ncbi:MAG: hypothetical protein KGM42_08205 [Hyphomicrobiales bacterium]|nr:hypothetical protein [Hyphomicrobiales bacterium]
MIAFPFFLIFCAIFESAFMVFSQGNLEAATYAVSRQLLTGQAQTASTPWTASTFRTNLCNPSVSGILALFDCTNQNKMFIDVRNASDFTTNPAAGNALFTSTSDTYSPGTSGAVIVVRVGYLYPLYFTGLFNSWGGSSSSTTRQMTSTVVFKSESY